MSRKGHPKTSYPLPANDCYGFARIKASTPRMQPLFNRRQQARSKPAKKSGKRQSGKRR
jgi:hypothetical protein